MYIHYYLLEVIYVSLMQFFFLRINFFVCTVHFRSSISIRTLNSVALGILGVVISLFVFAIGERNILAHNYVRVYLHWCIMF